MCKNKRGAALLQVLMLSALLAGLSVMVLRVTLARQRTANKARHDVALQMAISSCVNEVNNIWAAMTPEAYQQKLKNCKMPDKTDPNPCDGEADAPNKWYCRVRPYGNTEYCITAEMSPAPTDEPAPCLITFTVHEGVGL